MEREKVIAVLGKATALHKGVPGLKQVWGSGWSALPHDLRGVQAVIGKSSKGFHPGICVSKAGKRSVSYGTAVCQFEEAKAIAQSAAGEWMIKRRSEIESLKPHRGLSM